MHQGPGADLDWKDGSRNHILAVVGTAEDYAELRCRQPAAQSRGDGHVRRCEPLLVVGAVACPRQRRARTHRPKGSRYLPSMTCAFVNNMPDGAFDATERQFLDLLEVALDPATIDVRRYTMAGVPRGEGVAPKIAEQYTPAGQHPAGAAGPADRDRVEPGRGCASRMSPTGTTWSTCSRGEARHSLHAALMPFCPCRADRLRWDRAGAAGLEVHRCIPATGRRHASLDSRPRAGRSPAAFAHEHRRLRIALRPAGYEIAIQLRSRRLERGDPDVGASKVVLVQGHPEYDPSSLLREYRRDARRYVLA